MANAVCDVNQTALNLIQSERSIDLSCRPKQRLKINICKSHCISGAPLFPFAELDKAQGLSFPSSSASNGLSNEIQSREKGKHKKKKSSAREDAVENGVDILDMSLNKLQSTDDNNCFNIINDRGNNTPHQNNSISYEISIEDSPDELEKRSKKIKKKKQDHSLDSCFLSDDNTTTLQYSPVDGRKHRKKKRKSAVRDPDAECDAEDYSARKKQTHPMELGVENSALAFDHSPLPNSVQHSTMQDGNKRVRKHKKVKESVENESWREDHLSVLKERHALSINIESSSTGVTPTPIQHGQETSHGAREMNQENAINGEAADVQNPDEEVENENNNSNDDKDSLTYSEFLDTNLKRKRYRKHNKKKKREKINLSRSMMSAVGPILGRLDGEAPVVVPQVTTPQSGRHIFFSDADFEEEMTTPPEGTFQSQVNSSQQKSNTSQGTNEESTNETLPMWKQQLLKLASTPKPVVFQREIPDRINKTDDATKSLSDFRIPVIKIDPLKPVVNNRNRPVTSSTTDDLSAQNSKPVSRSSVDSIDLRDVSKTTENNNCISSTESSDNCRTWHDDNKKNVTESKNCFDEVDTQTSTGAEAGGVKRTLPECIPRIPNDIQSIVLTNYPIIDKVIAEDLILFKVLKLNEQNQPDCSKTILAKVNSSTSFPEKISLQIIEGCEECDLIKTVENSEGFNIELRWTDILEPRLFYP